MQKIICLLFFLFKTTFILCQNEYEKSSDSLLVLINETNDDHLKMDYYINLCDLYVENDLKEIKKINPKLFAVSKKINSKKGLAFYYFYNAILLRNSNQEEAAFTNIEESISIFKEIKDWDNYFIANAKFGHYLILNENYLKAENLLNENIKFALKLNNENVSYLYYIMSQLYNFKSDYNEALVYAKKALDSEKNISQTIKIYNLASNIYRSLKNFDEALQFNQMGIDLEKSISGLNLFFFTRAIIFFDMKRYHEALDLALNYKKHLVKKKSNRSLIDCNIFISKCYFYLEDYHLANKCVDEVLNVEIPRDDIKMMAYGLKSKISLKQHRLNDAKTYIDKALRLLHDNHYYEIKLFVYETKFEVEEQLGNYKTALTFSKKIMEINNLNYETDNVDKLNRLQINFNISEKENKIKSLQLQDLKSTMKIEKQKNYIIYISIACFVALLSVLFYVKNNITIKKKNALIESEKLLTQKSLQEKEVLLKEIHHRVKNNLQLVKSLLYLQAKQQDVSLKTFVEASQSRILSMALIHENLYLKGDLSQVDFKEYLHRLAQNILEAHKNENKLIELQIEVEPIYFNIQTAIPLGLIINELVTNAYKHAFIIKQKGTIRLVLKKKGDYYYELNVIDDGDGIGKFKRPIHSLGLDLVHQLVVQINGKLFLSHEEGMHFTIQFKKA